MGSPKKPIKVYVPIEIDVDSNGQMYPRTITWEDGRKYEIDRVLDVRPAPAARAGGQGDRYTIRMNRKETYIFLSIIRSSVVRYRAVGSWNEGRNKHGL